MTLLLTAFVAAPQASCTATYRAPELFDVPSSCVIDGARCDVWSLGASLFHAMYGASPFQRAVDEGGSLELAVIKCVLCGNDQP